MSIKIVKEQIEKFLLSIAAEVFIPQVLAIRGEWGIGKTFLWNKLFKDSSVKNKIKQYAYVSLAGINSLSEFKRAIFENMIDYSAGEGLMNDTATKNAMVVTNWFTRITSKFMPHVKTPFVNLSSVWEMAIFASINKAVICIDDFERKGKGLTSNEILGLILQLKEQKNCKIVLIFNDKGLSKSSLNIYKKYREKVIDSDPVFEPTAKESAAIALQGDGIIYDKLKQFASILNITNIRILKKIERLAVELKPLLSEYEPGVLEKALHSLTLFSLAFYSSNKGVPDLDYLLNIGNKMYGMDDSKEDEKTKLYKALLSEYKFYNITPFDLVIAAAVKNGYINESMLIEEAEKVNEECIGARAHGSLMDSWRAYRDNFDDNPDDVVENIYNGYKENIKFLTSLNLDAGVRLLRKLKRGELADKIIEFYVQENANKKELFNLLTNPFANEIKDEKLIEKFNSIYSASKPEKNIDEILLDIANRHGWSAEDKRVLDAVDEDTYYAIFKSARGDQLHTMINACLNIVRLENAKKALIRIAKENDLNAMRVASVGIKIDEENEIANAA